MISEEFRQAALRQPEAVEGEHGGHPDFRVRGKIFAGLTKDGSSASLKLDPEQQEILMAALPRIFSPAAGSWGRRGWTRVALEAAHPDDIMPALRMAWANTAPARLRNSALLQGEAP